MPAARGLILAAGRGRRLGALSVGRPKCLVRLGDRSLFDWQRDALEAAGVGPIAAVGGYRADLLPTCTGPLFVNHAWETTQMVSSLLCARSWLEEGPCIVSYGDIAFHPDGVRRLLGDQRLLAITYDRQWRRLWNERFADPTDDAESLVVDGDRLRQIGTRRPQLDRVQGQYMGLLRVLPEGLRFAMEWMRTSSIHPDRLQTTELLDGVVHAGLEVGAVAVDGRWVEVDTPGDLALYEKRLSSRERWGHDWRWLD